MSKKKKRLIYIGLSVLLPVGLFFCFPVVHFSTGYSTVLNDREGRLMGACIAPDGQWRFPQSTSVPEKFTKALLLFEDRYFYSHPGFNPVAFARAALRNVQAGRIRQGGSTLSMQTVRMARLHQHRTFTEKLLEIALTLRLEAAVSKAEILQMYASHAPFGGNVVGLEAASWRYFGRDPHHLSWSEYALLAVLPNSPSLIYPGKNHQLLLKKRNRLLQRLWQQGEIDKITCELACLEPLPGAPKPLPQMASHLLSRLSLHGHASTRIRSSLVYTRQERMSALLQQYYEKLKSNSVLNGAILLIDVPTGKVLAYVGNTRGADVHASHEVDIIAASRSYGSLLKPVLYAAMLQDGMLLPDMLVPDVPTNIAGYQPQNFFKEYDGVVPASQVLSRSLNVPSVRLLHQFGAQRFHQLLPNMGLHTLNKSAEYYGLSIILGGAEANLFELTGLYASMARSVLLRKKAFAPPVLFQDSSLRIIPQQQPGLSPSCLFFALEAIREAKRPGNDGDWLDFTTPQAIYWKTGTSYGSRDAWSIGVTGKYAVGVWIGNASGEGRAGLTGIGTAAPLMFDIFAQLPKSVPLKLPFHDVTHANLCRTSGYKAQKYCPQTRLKLIPVAGTKTGPCPYHQVVHLDKTGRHRVSGNCEQVSDMIHTSWFVLPTLQEWYYRNKHSDYKSLPPWKNGCQPGFEAMRNLEIIYPRRLSKLYIPHEVDGSQGMLVFEAAHREAGAVIYWHIDDVFVAETKHFHQFSVRLPAGWHELTLVDASGESRQVKFEVVTKVR